ncbi:hypothetical protein B7486_10590 [cyanobacterium TDX16]|nr:hypothetical protein B7486_10590 [cyanobacterium TDX16]
MKHGVRINSVRWILSASIILLPCVTAMALASPEPSAHDKANPESPLEIGKPAPPLNIEKLLQAPKDADASWPALKGKCVVLEFWATWCAPCVAAIPHINELSEEFKDKPIVFISLTDEDESKVLKFLKKRPIHTWIGLDSDKSSFRDYQVRWIPHTVLVDAKGAIVGITSPTDVKPDTIEALLAGRPLNLPEADSEEGLTAGVDPVEDGKASPPLYQVLIRPSDPSKPSGQGASGGGKMSLIQYDVVALISQVTEIPIHQIDSRAKLPDGKFDLIASMPRGHEARLRPDAQSAIKVAFTIVTRQEKRLTDVLVLKIPAGKQHKLTPAAIDEGGQAMSSWPRGLEMTNGPFDSFVDTLARSLKRPVMDETGLADRFDISLEWDDDSPDAIIKAVESSLGLELLPAKREVEFLVIEDAAKQALSKSNAAGGTK